MGGYMGKRAFLLSIIISLLGLRASVAGEWVAWNSPDAQFATTLVRLFDLTAGSAPITIQALGTTPSADTCHFHIFRPTFGENDLRNALNFVECQTTVEGEGALVRLDLSNTMIRYHGNRTLSKSLAWRGPVAEAIYEALKTYHAHEEWALVRTRDLSGPGTDSTMYQLFERTGKHVPFYCYKDIWYNYPTKGESYTFHECALTFWYLDTSLRSPKG